MQSSSIDNNNILFQFGLILILVCSAAIPMQNTCFLPVFMLLPEHAQAAVNNFKRNMTLIKMVVSSNIDVSKGVLEEVCIDFRDFWEPSSIPRRLGIYQKGITIPGQKRLHGYPQIIPGINMPGQETGFNNGVSFFRPFSQDLGVGINNNLGHSFGVGIYAAPTNNMKLPIRQLFPALLANGGSMPKFQDNPLLGSFDPFGTGFTTGVAWEQINYNFGGNLKFTEVFTKQDFDLNGGFSSRNGGFYGGIGVPMLKQRVQWPLAGHVTNTADDINVQYGHSLNNANALKIPIRELYPHLLLTSTSLQHHAEKLVKTRDISEVNAA